MKRVHVSLRVADLDRSVAFYNQLFGMEPTLLKSDYAKWMPADPPILLSIVTGGAPGLDHLGIQSEDEADVNALHERVAPTQAAPAETGCCYAESTKSWLHDPDGTAWENFTTHRQTEDFSGGPEAESTSNCCVPASPVEAVETSSCC